MGIFLSEAVVLREWISSRKLSGPLLALGVIDTSFSPQDYAIATNSTPRTDQENGPMPAKQFLETCGIHEVVSLDVSDYEGADAIFDLNTTSVPPVLVERFGIVLNHGTLEHVFHVPNALSNISRMLKPGGTVLHILPTHNCVDHGFYQFGPTLMFDYYTAAKFEILESAAFVFEPTKGRNSRCLVMPLPPGRFGTGLLGALDGRTIFQMFAARKTKDWVANPIPTQKLYADSSTPPAAMPRWFTPFETEGAHRLPCQEPLIVSLASFSHEGGLAWTCELSGGAAKGDTMLCPVQSSLALFEDDRLLGPPHSDHALIRNRGKGAFSHWGETLYMSSSDGTDPNKNNRRYTALIPAVANVGVRS